MWVPTFVFFVRIQDHTEPALGHSRFYLGIGEKKRGGIFGEVRTKNPLNLLHAIIFGVRTAPYQTSWFN